MLAALIALGTIGTLDVAVGLQHVLDALFWHHGPGDGIEDSTNIYFWPNVMGMLDFSIQTLIGDLVLVIG